MAGRRTATVPARLATARRRFDRWRGVRKLGARIPEHLWRSAVKLSEAYGLSRTARVLGLDYYALKKHTEAASAKPVPKVQSLDVLGRLAVEGRGQAAATFIELTPRYLEPPLVPGSREPGSPIPSGPMPGSPMPGSPMAGSPLPVGRVACVIELTHPRGSMIRLHIGADHVPDVASLCRDFWNTTS